MLTLSDPLGSRRSTPHPPQYRALGSMIDPQMSHLLTIKRSKEKFKINCLLVFTIADFERMVRSVRENSLSLRKMVDVMVEEKMKKAMAVKFFLFCFLILELL
jgi:hypothetical protein